MKKILTSQLDSLSSEMIEQKLATMPIVRGSRETSALGGTSGAYKVWLEDGTAAVARNQKWLPEMEGTYMSETVFAYKVSEGFELGMAPPAVKREHNGELVSLQLFVKGRHLELDQDLAQFVKPAELHRKKIHDYLIDNQDAINPENTLVLDSQELLSFDFNMILIQEVNASDVLPAEIIQALKHPELALSVERFKNMSEHELKIMVGEELTPDRTGIFYHRLGLIQAHLAKQK